MGHTRPGSTPGSGRSLLRCGSQEVDGFIVKFAEPMQDMIRGCRQRMADRFPVAMQMVYDNVSFLVIGSGPRNVPRRPSSPWRGTAAA